RNLEILLDTEIGEDAPAFRDVADALGRDAKSGPARGVLAEDGDPALACRRETHQASQRRRLSGAVASEQGGNPAFGNLQADAVQDMALAVVGMQAFGLEYDSHAA